MGIYAQVLKINEPVRFLALGDSYTIGQSVDASLSWPQQLFARLEVEGYKTETLEIVARTGWRTDNLLDAIENRNFTSSFNLVSLLIGVNNQFQRISIEKYPGEFESLLKTAINLAGNDVSNVFVLSIPDYTFTPFGGGDPKISKEIDAYNEINKKISADYSVVYFDITPISRQGLNRSDLVATDGLHPSGEMYSEWVNLIMEHMNVYNNPQYLSSDHTNDHSLFSILNNPVKDNLKLYLGIDIAYPININVFHILGQKVWGEEIELSQLSGNFFSIDLCGLSTGIYIIQFQISNKKESKIFYLLK